MSVMPSLHLPFSQFAYPRKLGERLIGIFLRVDIFSDKSRPWRDSSIKGLIESKNLPEYMVLPQPMLPTENPVVLELYSEAMKVVAEDDATQADWKEPA